MVPKWVPEVSTRRPQWLAGLAGLAGLPNGALDHPQGGSNTPKMGFLPPGSGVQTGLGQGPRPSPNPKVLLRVDCWRCINGASGWCTGTMAARHLVKPCDKAWTGRCMGMYRGIRAPHTRVPEVKIGKFLTKSRVKSPHFSGF